MPGDVFQGRPTTKFSNGSSKIPKTKISHIQRNRSILEGCPIALVAPRCHTRTHMTPEAITDNVRSIVSDSDSTVYNTPISSISTSLTSSLEGTGQSHTIISPYGGSRR
jgi:hypothetical protein